MCERRIKQEGEHGDLKDLILRHRCAMFSGKMLSSTSCQL